MDHRPFLLALVASLALCSGSLAAQKPLKIKEAKPGLLAKAKIKPEEAELTALAQVPAGRFVSGEIEMEKDKLVYSFDLKVIGKSGIDVVTVDALTGALVGVEHERRASEAKEKAREKAAPKKKPPTR